MGSWRRRIDVVAVAICGALIALAFTTTLPVGAVGDDAPATEFSAERAMDHVAVIAAEPHPLGSIENTRAREYIVRELETLDLEVALQPVAARDWFGAGGPIEVVNIISWIPGADNKKAVMFVGHYDSHPNTPGANDNAAAVAAMIETARTLRAGAPLRNDVIFLFTDGEEPSPRYGANGFASIPGVLDDIGLVVNFEANGSGGASTLVEVSGSGSWVVGEFLASASSPRAFSFLTDITGLIGDVGTDFDVFENAGLPGMHFAYLRGSPIYHTMADDLDSVHRGSMQHHGAHALDIARHFGDLDLSTVPDEGRPVFFTMPLTVVQYPESWAFVPGLLALGLLVVSITRSPGVATCSVLRSAGALGVGALTGAVAATLVWIAVVAVRSSQVIIESYLYLVMLLVLAAWAGRAVWSRLAGSEDARHGVLVVWTVLALLTGVLLPGFSYLFAWPAFAAAAALAWRASTRAMALVRFTAVALPTLLVMTPAVDYLALFAAPRPGNPGSQVAAAMLVPLVFGVLVFALLTSGWHREDATE